MNKDFILVASDSGACEIIRTEHLLKVYVEMPEANQVVFCCEKTLYTKKF